ncbi:type VI secretion system protein TssA [Sediminicoccus sp. KRV36]|uniref:type VI secretion system protein TssA n=1 Tax=Sediminicoccus sp. KRV36 TaxID=3133721 RepID=UPI00200DFE88|nr:type VI secretion system protein TssA [Sediminicoccus rosea]UPY37730.1 type VI secretion system protein TssA [Sediminicoccus rosea]
MDLETLLAPIGEEGGGGEDLRQDYSPSSIYQKLRDARSEARADERARDSEGEGESAVAEGWRQVRRLAAEALGGKSKDFEIAAWLTEALVRMEGLAGLAAGARLLAGLLDQHWDAGFPRPDEEGSEEERLEGRSAPLGGLAGGENDGTVMQPLRRAALFRRPSGETLSIYQYDAAEETAGLADEARREARYAQGVLALDTIETEAKFDRARLVAAVQLATEARAAWQLFQDQCDARFGYYSPSTRRVAEVLDRMVEVATRLGGGAASAESGGTEMMEAGDAATQQGSPMAGAIGVPGFNPAGREQALRTLEQLAAFFQKTEPHSFLAYTLADAARRGRMSLPELLAEVLQDDSARTAMLTALGIRPTAMEEQE